MSLTTAQKLAFNLATTLMVCIVLIQVDDGYCVMPADEFDGEPSSIVHEYDPFAR